MAIRVRWAVWTLPLLVAGCARDTVGVRGDGSVMTPNHQLLRPAGETLAFGGRPVDMALSADGRFLYALDNRGVVVIDASSWRVLQELAMPGGGSQHGIVVSPEGSRLYASNAQSEVHEAEILADGTVRWGRTFKMPNPRVGGAAYPTGLLLQGNRLVVALSRGNALAVVDLASGRVSEQIPVDVAPFALGLAPDGKVIVACWAARPQEGARTAPSAGTEVEVDERGIGVGGVADLVDLQMGQVVAKAKVGLQPSDIAVDGETAYVANANSDTVTELELPTLTVRRQIDVKPDAKLPFGSAPNALALDAERGKLYVANGGNTAVAQLDIRRRGARIDGYLPTGWYPSSLIVRDGTLYVANAKGTGSGGERAKRQVYRFQGTIAKVPLPDGRTLAAYTRQVKEDLDVPAILTSRSRRESAVAPMPVPKRLGDPSVFEHVVYILKENRTYDQVLGDIGKGDSDPSLTIYGKDVTPNLHALADEFVLLDNYYCNGVNSYDGHAWSIEGNATAYFEKTFGGWTRSETFGDDPLAVTSTGFLWDSVLARGLSFRNYGEYDYATPTPAATYSEIYRDFAVGGHRFTYKQNIGVERLRSYSRLGYPGWNLSIPDLVRADVFLKDLAESERQGTFPNLTIVYLPNDHTAGISPGRPTPRSYVAENDLATGQVVSSISKSKFWRNTCVFVIEDDPQDGFDHVDGHRSFCLIASPYTRRGAVVSDFYNQTSMLHTMLRMLGVPAMNQLVGRSSLMAACFTPKPDFTPYELKPNRVPLNEITPPLKSLRGQDRKMAIASQRIPLGKPDQGDEDLQNRILWHAARRGQRYPAEWTGPHGRGLAKRGLKLIQEALGKD